MAIAVSLKGLDGIMVAVNKTIAEAADGTLKALDKFQSNVVADAKRDAPANEGNLRNSISGTVSGQNTGKTANYKARIAVSANYAAYLEFGTRKFAAAYVATLPPDWQSYAATFKGEGGGTFDQFVQDLLQWVKAKGLRLEPKQYEQEDNYSFGTLRKNKKPKKQTILEGQQQLAYVIALKIMVEGIRPQPFLFPAVQKHTPVLIDDIKKVFDA